MSFGERALRIPGFSAIRAWFSTRSQREQLLLASLGIIVVGAVLVTVVGRPLTVRRDAALATIARYDALLARVELIGPAALDPVAGASGNADDQSIGGSAASHGLLIRRIEPEGENTLVVFESADFAQIIDWIANMENDGIARVVAIQLDRRPEPGTVNAQVTLEE